MFEIRRGGVWAAIILHGRTLGWLIVWNNVVDALEEYVKIINGRCSEAVGILPLGGEDIDWSENLDDDARVWCSAQIWCAGYMRYMGEDSDHCSAWCGRPQFCNATSLSAEEHWLSYLRVKPFVSEDEGSAEFHGNEEIDGDLQKRGPDVEGSAEFHGSAEIDADLQKKGPDVLGCRWPYTGSVALWHMEPPQDQIEDAFADDVGRHHETCQVFHHRRGQPLPRKFMEPYGQRVFFDGILSESEEVVAFFTANTSAPSWIYSFDSNDFNGATLGENTAWSFGPKEHYLSLFYMSEDAACDGKKPSQWGPTEAEEALPGHVFVDDGTLDLRRRAFIPYHFTVICGSSNQTNIVPQVLVDAIGFATHPLVAQPLHTRLKRVFFHFQDAAQPYTRIHPLVLEQYIANLYMDPEKNDAMYFKQSFLFLMQDLLRYRYRQPAAHRLVVSACGLCKELRRRLNLADAADASTHRASRALPREAVAWAVCVMSRRDGHVLRSAVRETWANNLPDFAVMNFFVGAPVNEKNLDAVVDYGYADVVELKVPETYRALTLKAFAMLDWTYTTFPNLRFLVRADDDIYLRPAPLFAQLEKRPPVAYMWGNFDHGSNPVRDPSHPHFNSHEQVPPRHHPLFGDIFPPYARGHLWAMSADLLAIVVDVWHDELVRHRNLSLSLAGRLPHPDDPALGVALANLVDYDGLSLNLDDRDLNRFALNPSCNATYLNIRNCTWVVHHVDAPAMRCMWSIDSASNHCGLAHGADKICNGPFPDLCPCSMDVQEEVDDQLGDGEDFDYPRDRFNE